MIIEENTTPEDDQMSIPTISGGYGDVSLRQKDDGLKQNIHIIGS